ncbi:MAG: hypothetical protein LBI74_10415 [Synergistaceae bacterium]|jgi:methionyl-tRNA formyltransferase|nr:hypothetical protein [Synergistaceae bacterium]
MKITVFTSNQPRHINLINSLAVISNEVFAIQECNTVFPGIVKDFFNNSKVMQDYFQGVIRAEKKIFGDVKFVHDRVRTLSIKGGDLNNLELNIIKDALESDIYIVFGASYIKGDLIDFLVKQNAINIHMGVSPYYRGNSCNFWALYDSNIEYIGATIHKLSLGLDSGDILFHALPKVDTYEPFDVGMHAVKSAIESLITRIKDGKIFGFLPVPQDKSLEIRYTKNKDFDDDVALDFMNNPPSSNDIRVALNNRDMSKYIQPYC